MKNTERILEKYRDDKRTADLIAAFSQDAPARLQLEGLAGSAPAFVVAGNHLARPGHHLFIADDKESAAYMQNDVANLMGKKPVRFFPDSFKRPMAFERLNNTNVLQRAETVNKISSGNSKGEIIVTYPEALFEMVVAPQVLAEKRFKIAKGENVDVDFLIEILVEYGFDREDFVYEPGQFSVRGGIVDIFSYGNDYPYRVDLFDEEVESIRTFDPTTQLSVRNIASVSIVPNLNTKFTHDQKVSLFKILPENTVVWAQNFDVLLDKLQTCYERAAAFAETITVLDKSEIAEIFRDRAFIRPDEVVGDVEKYSLVLVNGKPPSPLKKIAQPKFDRVIYNTSPQTSFNKNFKLLIGKLKENSADHIENFIFTENPRQIERFYAIFNDLEANVEFHPANIAIAQGFVNHDFGQACYTDHQIFGRFHRPKMKQGFSKDKAVSLKMLRELVPGDFVVHIDHGVGRYSGLEKININGHVQESVRLIYQNNDVLYVSINSLHKLSKFRGKDGAKPKLNKIGSDAWQSLKRKTKRKMKDMASELIKLYAKRKAADGHAFPEDGYLQAELESSFVYEDTPDQSKATEEVKEDMQKAYPMDRLICGDVGFGKTEIAVRAAFKAVVGGKQVAILVPTTILALQHYKTFRDRLDGLGVDVDYVNRFKTAKEKTAIFEKLKEGKLDIVIGTHAILSKKIGFKDLGLLIIDEEQKFGVAAKEKLRSMKVNVDTLTLTATPIPRTLQFSLMAARDLSIIRTPPPNRQPIHTEMRVFNPEVVKEAVDYEIARGGQVFFVHNRVKTLPEITAMIRRLCPDTDIAMAHGQMESKSLEKVLLDFIDRRYDVLVCTNIIETGLDIPNANTMMINNAQQFGMSDLHQLRGRIGRSNKKAFCYLFTPPISTLTADARKRLRTIEEFSDLGSGFDISMRDLDIRGAGNLLGGEQSGFISDIGYETYQKILEEAVHELKNNEFKELFKEDIEKRREFVTDVTVETDEDMLLPDSYVQSIQERLRLYTQLDDVKNEQELVAYGKMLQDRFGKIPKQAHGLFFALRCRWICKELGFERLILKDNKLRCFFVEDAQSAYYESDIFKRVFQWVGTKGKTRGISVKQSRKYLIMVKENVKSLREARVILQLIREAVYLEDSAGKKG